MTALRRPSMPLYCTEVSLSSLAKADISRSGTGISGLMSIYSIVLRSCPTGALYAVSLLLSIHSIRSRGSEERNSAGIFTASERSDIFPLSATRDISTLQMRSRTFERSFGRHFPVRIRLRYEGSILTALLSFTLEISSISIRVSSFLPKHLFASGS